MSRVEHMSMKAPKSLDMTVDMGNWRVVHYSTLQ